MEAQGFVTELSVQFLRPRDTRVGRDLGAKWAGVGCRSASFVLRGARVVRGPEWAPQEMTWGNVLGTQLPHLSCLRALEMFQISLRITCGGGLFFLDLYGIICFH